MGAKKLRFERATNSIKFADQQVVALSEPCRPCSEVGTIKGTHESKETSESIGILDEGQSEKTKN